MELNKIKHDPRLIELIKVTDQKTLAIWAIDCLTRILPIYEHNYPNDSIPDEAIKILKQWLNDEITMWEARKYCWTILKKAKELESADKVACQILRACSHTLATCHVKTHSEGSAMYVVSALYYLNKDKENVSKLLEEERNWQINHLLTLNKKQ